jgi:hypothetical protein
MSAALIWSRAALVTWTAMFLFIFSPVRLHILRRVHATWARWGTLSHLRPLFSMAMSW